MSPSSVLNSLTKVLSILNSKEELEQKHTKVCDYLSSKMKKHFDAKRLASAIEPRKLTVARIKNGIAKEHDVINEGNNRIFLLKRMFGYPTCFWSLREGEIIMYEKRADPKGAQIAGSCKNHGFFKERVIELYHYSIQGDVKF